MRQIVNQPVTVSFVSTPGKSIEVQSLFWQKRRWLVQQQNHSYTIPRGLGKCHAFCLIADGQYFEVILDPVTLVFILREVSDGMAD
jgi:hypothetical protein